MNWDALGAIGELVGALGVIATLVYVAVQLRQSTRAVRAATLNATTASQQAELRWSSDIGQAVTTAFHRPEELTELETHQVTEWMTAAFLARENEYRQHQKGLLERDKWEQSKTIVQMIAGIPWFRNWWSEYGRHVYTVSFVEWVDQVMVAGVFDTPSALRSLEGTSTSDE